MGNDARSTSGGSSSTLGLVYSSANANAQSLIRIFNGTSSNDWMHSGASVTLTLHDGSTGTTVGTWVSPLLKAGVSMQFPIAEIESGLSPGVTKPATYAITAQAAKTGMAIQNEVLRSNDGLLSNMTACDTGVASLGRVLINVHSSQFSGNYPSTVAITNSGAKTLGFSVEIYDAEGGYFMGSFPTPIIPSGGHVIMSVAAMEAAAHITPSRFTPTYVIRFGRSSDGDYNFTAFFQHLVNNTRSGVITDMTTLCPVGGPEPSYHSVDGSLHTGLIFSSANGSGQSYLQIANTDSVAGTVTLTLQDSAAGTSLGRWTSPSIPAGAAQEFPIGDIEGAVPLPPAKPAYYGLTVQSTFAGELQHVLRANSDSTPTDLSICDFGTGPSSSRLNGVHSSRLDATFPSTVVVTNTATTPGPVTLALYDATTGTRLGAATTPPIPAGGHLSLSSSELETAAQVTPSASQLRYVIRTEGTFSGFLQHLVTNTNTGAVTDLTIACKLQLDSTKDNQPPLGATLADVPPGVDLAHLPPGIDLSRLSPSLRDLILSLQ
ncbi:MAG: hypothetical protein EPO08_00330 [Rhodospirillaceae bacterium]|nr:MAG: hypothetical protein EPO08_00330 [Rhodospirillaceae bacterium]